MSSDEKELYEIEQREKAVRDEISARAYERKQGIAQGIAEKEKELIEKWRRKGYTEEQIQELLS